MEEKNNLDVFLNMPIYKSVFYNAIPAMTAMLMVLIYNLADTFFIGQTNDDLLVAAVSISTPVFLIFTALGTVFGVGGTSLISRSLGEGKTKFAKKVSSFCMWMCIGVGIVVSFFMLIFLDQILKIIGTNGDTMPLAHTYMKIVLFCGPCVLIANCFSNVIRSEGNSNQAMLGLLLGNLLNVILDPILILVFNWGIKGAAIATVIGNVVATVYYILYFFKENSILSINIKDFQWKEGVLKEVLKIGIPASLGSLLMSFSQIIINEQMITYGNYAVAGVGVSMKIMMIIMLLAIGLGQGIQPLLGYCVGANDKEKFNQILKFSLWFALLLEIILSLGCYMFITPIVSLFLTNTRSLEYAVQFTRIYLSTGILFGVFYVMVNAIQAMGEGTASFIINIARQGLIYIPMLYIFKYLIGINGLIWSQPVADILSFILTVVLYIKVKRKHFNDI